jgi:TolB protein
MTTHRKNPLLRRTLFLLLMVVMLVLTGLILSEEANGRWPLARAQVNEVNTTENSDPSGSIPGTSAIVNSTEGLLPTASPSSPPSPSVNSPTASATLAASATPDLSAGIPIATDNPLFGQGTLFLAMDEGGYTHIFAYQPQSLPLTRLTAGPWDDITPSVSPDGKQMAFASNRDGHWDLYAMDLSTGEVNRLTDTPEYDASPSWSPDGQWLVYESYPLPSGEKTGGNLDLFIRQVNAQNQNPIQLTSDPGADFDPSWSPKGRQIAFVSNRSGENEIWLADLDKIDDRFQNISRDASIAQSHPAWSLDGSWLAWSANTNGYSTIYRWSPDQPGSAPQYVGSGDQAVWSPNGEALIASLSTPNQTYLTGYAVHGPGLALPPLATSGPVKGMSWDPVTLPQPLPDLMLRASNLSPTPDWQPALTPASDVPNGRQRVVPLDDVEAPTPMLQDMVDESFRALRKRLASAIGWDFLSTLENAYVPLTAPLGPGMLEDWLYTGRAISINPVPINAGWMVVMREDYGSATYWHIYLRTRFQDGTQGQPLHDLPWNFNARYSGNPRYYEQGGALAEAIPPGYWLDFTQLAADYGWQRLPALSTWHSAYSAARYTEFALTGGLDWYSAMLEIYPPQALYTPTPVLPPTMTPTATRWPTRTPTPTRTPWPSRTPTSTRTPSATVTPTPIPTATGEAGQATTVP